MVGRAMVTGGAGFIGSALVDRLVDDGAKVIVVDDLSSGKLARLTAARASGEMQFHQADIRAPEVETLVRKFAPDVVFHLAAHIDAAASVADPVFDASVNVVGTVSVLQACVASGVKRLVYLASGGAMYGAAGHWPATEKQRPHPATPYGVSKSVVDDYLRLYHETRGLEYVALGPSNVYGPRQDGSGEGGVVATFIAQLLSGQRPTVFGDGTQTRDFVYVEDVADACVRAAERGANRYLNIGTGVETSVNELLRLLVELTGRRIAPVYAEPRAGDVARSSLDSSAALRQLGWEPWTSLTSGLEQTVRWFANS